MRMNFDHFLVGRALIYMLADLIDMAARSGFPVILTGPPGVGKGAIAHAIHMASPRWSEPFETINCGTLSPELAVAELAGHVKGSFSSSIGNRPGLLRTAGGGTAFLDEVGELPMPVQAALLRIVESKCVRPVGSDVEVAIQARIITATNRPMEWLRNPDNFRADLLHRISSLWIQVPPLRRHAADIPELANHFIRAWAEEGNTEPIRLSPQAMTLLSELPFPGNVRELRDLIGKLTVRHAGHTISKPLLRDELSLWSPLAFHSSPS